MFSCETVDVSPANSFSGGRRRCLGILIENEVVTLGSQHKDKQLSLLSNYCERLTSVLDHWIWDMCYVFAGDSQSLKNLEFHPEVFLILFSISLFVRDDTILNKSGDS